MSGALTLAGVTFWLEASGKNLSPSFLEDVCHRPQPSEHFIGGEELGGSLISQDPLWETTFGEGQEIFL